MAKWRHFQFVEKMSANNIGCIHKLLRDLVAWRDHLDVIISAKLQPCQKHLTSSLIITLTLTISATLANLPTFVDGLIYEWNG